MVALPENPTMQDFQRYVHDMEAHHGWLKADLVQNCFLMGEEVGELFKAVRVHTKLYVEKDAPQDAETIAHVAEEIVDVFNYLAAIANRLDIDLEDAFRKKNSKNMTRTWSA